jgi:hypothetical protein
MAVPEHPRYEAHGIPANHINMSKVISKEDEGYRYLLEAIKQAYVCDVVIAWVLRPYSLLLCLISSF